MPTPPPFDAEIERALERRRDIVVTSMSREDIPRVRALGGDVASLAPTTHWGFDRVDVVAPGADGHPDVPLVILAPPHGHGPVPVLVFLHGGGLIAGTAEADLDLMAELAHEVGCAVASVEYRLAPEHPYPAALEDVVTAVGWLRAGHGPDRLDPERMVLVGISAGGGLAASAGLALRDAAAPAPAGLLLMCPMLDHRSDSCSARQMVGLGSWDATANATAWEAYLAGADPTAHASAAVAEDLGGLPPVFIDVGSAETFRDECVDFASRIWARGGDAELHVWPGGAHAFDVLAPWARMSRDARRPRVAWLRRLLDRL
ncbi:alpha/beta hydrolase [Demequina sp. NBRC 110053]|uniref:alpha/beta hydrolase n=1 Tax=Demequina sp. NBRC 110053 TaxID=1570342 RepID=UPI001F30DF6B|nr:alpha/beta hydrolase [Demequina sp. NBRC 110053]